jgi:glycosyltransferase involved in cell wall biosynthesis
MRILYIASAVVAPGSHGGATHVVEVAGELSKLGHEVHIFCARNNFQDKARFTLPVEGGKPLYFYRTVIPKWVAILALPLIFWLANRLKPEIIMERYYNFAGAGMLYARLRKIPAILEVNALMLDPLTSLKRKLDRTILFNRLKWWAEQQCRWAYRIVTPLHTTVPPSIPREKIVELAWGANIEKFDRSRISPEEAQKLRKVLNIPETARVAAFAGSFRHWHGVDALIKAARLAIPQDDQLYFLLLGGGALYEQLKTEVKDTGLDNRIIMLGAITYDRMPLYLALADCGVAQFDTSKHAPLREAGFYWSPLKLFEYMALGLPTITTDIKPLNQIIRPGCEGLLFPEGDVPALARAILALLAPAMTEKRQIMGQSARERVVAHYSWQAHCVALDKIIMGARGQGLGVREQN